VQEQALTLHPAEQNQEPLLGIAMQRGFWHGLPAALGAGGTRGGFSRIHWRPSLFVRAIFVQSKADPTGYSDRTAASPEIKRTCTKAIIAGIRTHIRKKFEVSHIPDKPEDEQPRQRGGVQTNAGNNAGKSLTNNRSRSCRAGMSGASLPAPDDG